MQLPFKKCSFLNSVAVSVTRGRYDSTFIMALSSPWQNRLTPHSGVTATEFQHKLKRGVLCTLVGRDTAL